jgi:RNA polymerase sigma factor (sigma-70 family)
MTDSNQLLRDYAERGDEHAFRQLVERYTNLVYSTALRQVGGDSHLAQDITQTVFSNLARKARSLSREVVLGGWLYRDAAFTASKARRSAQRRELHEQEAATMNALNHEDAGWQQIEFLIEEAMSRLGAKDRNALVLRFFEGQPLAAVGAALGSSEDAARMRVDRALEKLRKFFVRRGVMLSAMSLAAALSDHVVTAAPAGLAQSAAATALTDVATSGGQTIAFTHLFTSNIFRIGLVTVAIIGVVTWLTLQQRANPKPKANGRPLPEPVAPEFLIGAAIRRARPPSIHSTTVTTRSGQQAIATYGRAGHRLNILPEIGADNTIRIESTFTENISAPNPEAIKLPTVTTTNGQKAAVTVGAYTFEFIPWIKQGSNTAGRYSFDFSPGPK